MKKYAVSMSVVGAMLALGSSVALAAPDWSKVPKRDVVVFHPGTTPIEWIAKSDHSGRTGLVKGETCIGCHEEKGGLNFDFKRLASKDLEPKGAPKTMSFRSRCRPRTTRKTSTFVCRSNRRPAAPITRTRKTRSRRR